MLNFRRHQHVSARSGFPLLEFFGYHFLFWLNLTFALLWRPYHDTAMLDFRKLSRRDLAKKYLSDFLNVYLVSIVLQCMC